MRGRASGYRCLVVSWSRGPAAPESVWVGKNLPAKREDDPQSEGSGEVLLGGARGDPQSVGERRSFLGGQCAKTTRNVRGDPQSERAARCFWGFGAREETRKEGGRRICKRGRDDDPQYKRRRGF